MVRVLRLNILFLGQLDTKQDTVGSSWEIMRSQWIQPFQMQALKNIFRLVSCISRKNNKNSHFKTRSNPLLLFHTSVVVENLGQSHWALNEVIWKIIIKCHVFKL